VSLNSYDLSAGLFIRGLTNLKAQLTKAEAHAAALGSGEEVLLGARLSVDAREPDARYPPADVHLYTLADQVHWAAEGARLAITRLVGAQPERRAKDAKSFADLQMKVDETIAYLREVVPSDLEAGLERTIIVEHPRGSIRAGGERFLAGYAIPHFLYHVSTAYGIMRNQGVQLTMGDFLGNWAAN
jgi:hypothetical protein